MPITPADALDLAIARGPPNLNLGEQIAGIPKAYYAGLDEAYKRRTQDAFQGGVPMTTSMGPDGKPVQVPDWAKISQTSLGTAGTPGIAPAISAQSADLEQRKMLYQQMLDAKTAAFERGDGSPPQQAPQGEAPPGGGNRMGSNSLAGIISNNLPDLSDGEKNNLARRIAQGIGVTDPAQPLTPVQMDQVTKQVGRFQMIPGQPPAQSAPAAAPGPPPAPAGAPQPPAPGNIPVQPPQSFSSRFNPATGGATGPIVPPTQMDPRDKQTLDHYGSVMRNPMASAQQVAEAKLKVEDINKKYELTPEQKLADQMRRQGNRLGVADTQSLLEANKEHAKEVTKKYVESANAIQESGSVGRKEIPKLQLALHEMSDPNFHSGTGSKYLLNINRAIEALGGDPSKGRPMEIFGKVISDNIANGLATFKGLGGQIRNAQIRIIEQATASRDNTVESNRTLTTMAMRVHQRNDVISTMLQDYGGRMDPGFEKMVAEYDRQHPLISPDEIKDPQKISPPVFKSGAEAKARGAKGWIQSPNGEKYFIP